MKTNHIPLYQKLYEDIKTKIINKEYKKNSKLESVRGLAKRLDISTTTVEKTYNQLLVEGYVKSIPRSGYIVLDVHSLDHESKYSMVEPVKYQKYQNNQLTEDLFDIKSYKSIVNKVINYQSDKLFTECDPRGELELREEIKKYVLTERNVTCDINQIIVGPGTQSLLNMLLSLEQKKTVTYLTPEFSKAMNVFRAHNYTLKPRKSVTEICRLKSDFLYISPSNIYPTGEVIKAKDRNDIIKWAKENNTYIIEDDYNFFIRYNSYTIPSLQSIDPESVIYMGSFAKTIIPSIRISYMILPINLYNIYKDVFMNYSQGVSKLDQLSLSQFMKEGLFKRHTKKLYNLYKEKNDYILKAIDSYNKDNKFKVRGTDSNLHVIIDFKAKENLDIFIRNCERYYLKYDTIKGKNSVIFPYSGIENHKINSVIKDLFYNM